jgi:glycosyltransferase involved in cell wall biosynthesis
MARILLDLTPLVTSAALRGIGRYVRGLVQGLEELGQDQWQGIEIHGLAAADDLGRLLPPVERLSAYSERETRTPVKNCDLKRSSLVTFQLVRTARGAGANLVHLTEPRGVPLSRDPIITVTSHDLIVLAQRHLYLPPIPAWSVMYRALEHLRYKSAKRIIAVSQATKRDLIELLGFDARRIDVANLGVDHHRFRPESAPDEAARIHALVGSGAPYIVYLGAGDPRKDLETLVRAHALVARHGVRLVFAGHLKAARRMALERLALQLGTRAAVHFAGFVAEDLVPALYRQAAVHVFPSRYEGFGLPVLEALACGTPTITSPGSSLDEVASDAAEIVPCGEPDTLAAALERVLSDGVLRDAMTQRGLMRAREFTWQRCAKATVGFWQRSLSASVND